MPSASANATGKLKQDITRRSNERPLIRPTKDDDADRNFANIDKSLATLGPAARGVVTRLITLVVGDNEITPPFANPEGAIRVYVNGGGTLNDIGMVNGKWIINATAIGSIKLMFI